MLGEAYFYLLMSWVHWPARRRIAVDHLRVVKSMSGASRVVDVGCGPALFIRDVLDAGFSYLGVDTEPGTMVYCRRTYGALPGVRFAQCELGAISAEINKRDVLVFNGVYHHVDDAVADSFWTIAAGAHSVIVGDHYREAGEITALNRFLQERDRGKFVRDYAYFRERKGFVLAREAVVPVPGSWMPVWRYFTNLYVPR